MYCSVSKRKLDDVLADFKKTRELSDEFKILISDAELEVLIQKVAKDLNDTYKNSTEVVHLIGLLTGAYYFLAKLSCYLTFRYQIHFLKVTSYSGEKQIEVIYQKDAFEPYKKERNVIFIDELIDTGKTMRKILEIVPSAKTCACLTKGKQADFFGCDFIPNAWLIGFGLDDNGEKRGYPHLLCKHITDEDYLTFRNKFCEYMHSLEAGL